LEDTHAKLTRGLMRSLDTLRDADRPLPIIVRYAPTRIVLRGAAVPPGIRERYAFRLLPYEAVHATRAAIASLEANPDVLRIYQDLPVHALQAGAAPAYGSSMEQIQVTRLWAEGLTGKGVRIAIVDSGIDAAHPDFAGRIVATADFTHEGVEDRHGHGTHCASIAAGSGAASAGKVRGAAPEASIMAARVLDATGGGLMSDVMAGVEWAVEQGAQVISLSLGGSGPCDGSDALSETCDAATERGIILCVAAGNDGPEPYSVGSPGCARQVLTIGAVDSQDRVADFSSRGPTVDGRVKPDVLLPGVAIVAARAAGTSMGTVVDSYYTTASGTSMATPHASGICALLLQALPQLKPEEMKARLLGTAVSLGLDANTQGKGRVDAWAAVHQAPAPQPTPAPPAPGKGCLPALAQRLIRRPQP
jgi:subtilisin family serine protease